MLMDDLMDCWYKSESSVASIFATAISELPDILKQSRILLFKRVTKANYLAKRWHLETLKLQIKCRCKEHLLILKNYASQSCIWDQSEKKMLRKWQLSIWVHRKTKKKVSVEVKKTVSDDNLVDWIVQRRFICSACEWIFLFGLMKDLLIYSIL